MASLQMQETFKLETITFIENLSKTMIQSINEAISNNETITVSSANQFFMTLRLLEFFIPSSKAIFPTLQLLDKANETQTFDYTFRRHSGQRDKLNLLTRYNHTLRLLNSIRTHITCCPQSEKENDATPCFAIYTTLLRCTTSENYGKPNSVNTNFVYKRAIGHLIHYFKKYPTRSFHTVIGNDILTISVNLRDEIITKLKQNTFGDAQVLQPRTTLWHYTREDYQRRVRITYETPTARTVPMITNIHHTIQVPTYRYNPRPRRGESVMTLITPNSLPVTSFNPQYSATFSTTNLTRQQFNAPFFPNPIQISADPRLCIYSTFDEDYATEILTTIDSEEEHPTLLKFLKRLLDEYYLFKQEYCSTDDTTDYIDLSVIQRLVSRLINVAQTHANVDQPWYSERKFISQCNLWYYILLPCYETRNYWTSSEMKRLFGIFCPKYATSFHIYRLLTFISFIYEYFVLLEGAQELWPVPTINESRLTFCRLYDRINVPSLRLFHYCKFYDAELAQEHNPSLYYLCTVAQRDGIRGWIKLNPRSFGITSGSNFIGSFQISMASEFDYQLSTHWINQFEGFVLNRIGFDNWPRKDNEDPEDNDLDDEFTNEPVDPDVYTNFDT